MLLLLVACDAPQEITLTVTVEPAAQALWADALPAEVVVVFEPEQPTDNAFDKAWSLGGLCGATDTPAVFSAYIQDKGCAEATPLRALIVDGREGAHCGEKLEPLTEKPDGERAVGLAFAEEDGTCNRTVSDTVDLLITE